MDSGNLTSIFGVLDESEIREYYLDNGFLRCSILDYGFVLKTLFVPNRHGDLTDVVLGYDSLDQYSSLSGRMGAVIGRYANRIKNGSIRIDDKTYQLSKNRGDHHIHGGFVGFDRKIWKVLEHDALHILLSYVSIDGEEGYPGELSVLIEYRLSNNSICIRYMAVSKDDTVCNLTNHSYFNLSGNGTIDEHYVLINAKRR